MRKLRLDDPDLLLADMMVRWPETAQVFLARGMLCVGCLIGPFHTLDDAAAEYAIDRDKLLAELQAAVRAAVGRGGPADGAGSP